MSLDQSKATKTHYVFVLLLSLCLLPFNFQFSMFKTQWASNQIIFKNDHLTVDNKNKSEIAKKCAKVLKNQKKKSKKRKNYVLKYNDRFYKLKRYGTHWNLHILYFYIWINKYTYIVYCISLTLYTIHYSQYWSAMSEINWERLKTF